MNRYMYRWRKVTSKEQQEMLAWRKGREFPWHRPPHQVKGVGCFHVTAACYEHAPFVGTSLVRMKEFSEALLEHLRTVTSAVHSWCVLPNHYHLLVEVTDLKTCLKSLGLLHGRTSYKWNGEEGTRGRKVWSPPADRGMRSEAHFWSTMNYIHHNPVRHHYVKRWLDWPFSSAHAFLESVGRKEAVALWQMYPVGDYGAGWDEPEL